MREPNQPIESLLNELKERAKELNCLYEVKELTNKSELTPEEVFRGVVRVLPPGWQFPDKCQAKIEYDGAVYHSPDFKETPWVQRADIVVQDEVVGTVSVYYTEEMPTADEGPFLKEERKLLDTIAERLGHFLLHRKLREVFQRGELAKTDARDWRIVLDLLKRTDPQLLMRISRKMTNYLCWSGSVEAERLLAHFSPAYKNDDSELFEDINRPHQKTALQDFLVISEEIFLIADDYLGQAETLACIQKWIK
jgi:hypothetical protein